MAASYTSRVGNTYVFPVIASDGTATLEFDRPVKQMIWDTNVSIKLTDDAETPNEGGVLYGRKKFPNYYGYPIKFYVKNDSGDAILPVVTVEEYGDEANPDYFAEEE